MHNLILPTTLPNMDSFAPKLCLCGKETVETHGFWYCSTKCARLDSLQSLDNSHGHYRENAHRAYVRAGVRDLYPRRMMSAGHLHPNPSKKSGFSKAQARFQLPTNAPQKSTTTACKDTHDRNMAGFPTLAQVTGKFLVNRADEHLPLVPPKDLQKQEVHPIAPSRTDPAHKRQEHASQQISLDDFALPEPYSARSLKTVPRPKDGLKNIRTSVAAVLNAIKSRKDKNGENPERIFGHLVNGFVPPTRKESLFSHHQGSIHSTNPASTSKALRRSASFAGRDAITDSDFDDEDPLLQIIEELRQEFSGDFDPRSLFEIDGSF